ncbi:MAG TPA: prepilin-type N-terminal cleavage/methylation domain-containing protein [Thermoanaerobaculia bacterium]|nr:prepilin-type N-terminal cleavage/methylation domain-containing protein [Thermoanaerobaculia bacterium]
MNTHYRKADNHQRGFSLVEVLIAVTIFAVIFIAALMMYDRSTGVFKRGVEAADSQQNTRVAFDRLAADLRMAGFDYDRDGFPSGSVGTSWAAGRAYGINVIVIPTVANGFTYRATTAGTSHATIEPTWPLTEGATVNDNGIIWTTQAGSSQAQQPDEQIEYAGPAAITIRANFDFESDVVNENGREPDYQNSQFPVVTTANDEIVTYALRSRDASMNVDSVTFFADVNAVGSPPLRAAHPGGTAERLVTIGNVDLSNANPPYTLIRFTMDDEANVVATPLAENIRSLNFLYFMDIQGVTPLRDLAEDDVPDGSTILGAGQYNPAAPGVLVEGRAVRSRIKSIRMQLVGMNEQPDPAFTDPIETVASAIPYRKYRLETLIVPRNLGKRGLREQDTTPPGAPVLTSVSFGHCGIAKLEWTAPIDGGAVEQYTVLYDNDGDDSDGYAFLMQVGTSLQAYPPVYTKSATWATDTWDFRVQAVSSFGNGPLSNKISGQVKNRTRPQPISGLATSDGTTGVILTWQRPDENVVGLDDIVATPGGAVTTEGPTVGSEPLFYEVYRGNTINFTPDLGNRIHDGFAAGAATTSTATGVVTFTDNTAVNCKDYYYRVRVRDLCGIDSDRNVTGRDGVGDYFPPTGTDAILGRNDGLGLAPAAPSNLVIETSSTCNGTTCTVNLSWPRVTTDTAANLVAIDTYVINRQRQLGSLDAGPPDTPEVITVDPTSETVTATQTVPDPASSGGTFDKYEFTVVAELCSIQSAPSPARTFPCAFSGGTPTTNVSSTIDGSGTIGNPYVVFGSSNLTVDGLTAAATSVIATIYKDTTVVAGPGSYTISGGSAVIPLGDPDDDGSLYRADLTIQDTGGCVFTTSVYFVGSATNCCLVLQSVSGVLLGSSDITVDFRNQCTSNLTLNSSGTVTFNWNSGVFPGGTKLDRIVVPKIGGGTTAQVLSGDDRNAGMKTHSITEVSTDYNLPAGGTYTMLFDFSRNITATTSDAVRDMCVTYGTTSCNIIDDGAAPACP